VRVEFHHLARQSGRTELDDFGLGEHLAVAPMSAPVRSSMSPMCET
jgi:hypothetical protein